MQMVPLQEYDLHVDNNIQATIIIHDQVCGLYRTDSLSTIMHLHVSTL